MGILIVMGQAFNILHNKNSYYNLWKFWPEQSEEKKNKQQKKF